MKFSPCLPLLHYNVYLSLHSKYSYMYKLVRLIPFILCLSVILSSCSSSDNNSKYISKDAVGVLSINTKKLATKIAINALSGSPIFKEMTEKAGADSSDLDIEKTGIDPLNMLYVYGLADQRLPNKSKFMMIVPLKNADKFKAFVKDKFPEATFSLKGKLNFVTFNKNICMGWDEKTAIVSAATPSYNEWDDAAAPAAEVDMITLMSEDIEKTFTLDKKLSLASNEKFASLEKENHDISFWLNYEGFINSMPQEQIGTAGTILASQQELLKDIYVAGGVDFEKGKVVSEAKYYFNSKMKTLVDALESQSVNNDLLKRVPGQQMNMMMSYHFNPKGITTLLNTIGMLPLTNLALNKEYNLTVDDVTKAFTGDFLLAVTDFSVASESKSYSMNGVSFNQTSPVPSFKASLSFKINDKTAYDKLMQLAVGQEMVQQGAPGVYAIGGGFATLVNNDKYAAVSNDVAVAQAFLTEGSSKFNLPKEVTSQPYGFYADIKNTVKNIPLDLLYGKEDTAVFHDGRMLLESIRAYGGEVKGDYSEFHFDILFQNKDENSLMQLINFSQKIAEAEMKQANSIDDVLPQEDEEAVDSTSSEAI